MISNHHTEHATIASYTFGFILSIALTLGSFWVAPHFNSLATLLIVSAALVQLFVQLYFFLHVGQKDYPSINTLLLALAVIIIGILLIGTLWIMQNLSRLHGYSPTETDIYSGGLVAPQNELH